MIIEMRTYKTKPGRRSQFVEIFRSKSIPAHTAIGEKWTQYFHSDCGVCRNRFGAEYLNELGAPAGLRFIGAHFDDHLRSPPACWRGWRKTARMHFAVIRLPYGNSPCDQKRECFPFPPITQERPHFPRGESTVRLRHVQASGRRLSRGCHRQRTTTTAR